MRHTSGADATPSARAVEVADGIFAYVQLPGGWCVSNAGILPGERSVTLIDATATIPRARRLREAVAGLSPHEVGTLVNTHHHGDHTFGNAVFPAATIVGHALTGACMVAEGTLITEIWPHVEWGEVRIVEPTVTLTDRLTLWVDDTRVELIHLGPAHTTNDVVAWLPESRVLFAGDITFSGGTPFTLGGSVGGSLRALEELRALDPRTVVSGHGPIAGPEVIETNVAYLSWIQKLTAEGTAAGLEPLTVAREADLGEFADLLDPERLVANLHRAYSEARGVPWGTPLPITDILAEMIVFNDGQIPTCLA
jgi:cyclase